VHLLPAVFCVARTAHKFDFWLAIKETPKNGDQSKEGNAVMQTHIFDSSCPECRREC